MCVCVGGGGGGGFQLATWLCWESKLKLGARALECCCIALFQ